MNNTIKIPLFLITTCFISATLLSSVVMLTDPIIEKAKLDKIAKAYELLYEDEKVEIVKTIILDKEFINQTNIQEINRIKHDEKMSVVYKLKSESSYETMFFLIGIDETKAVVDSYCFLESNKASYGSSNFKNNEEVINIYKDYNGINTPILSGTTITSKAVKTIIDRALEDFKQRNWEE